MNNLPTEWGAYVDNDGDLFLLANDGWECEAGPISAWTIKTFLPLTPVRRDRA
jgi:hypothetical protein